MYILVQVPSSLCLQIKRQCTSLTPESSFVLLSCQVPSPEISHIHTSPPQIEFMVFWNVLWRECYATCSFAYDLLFLLSIMVVRSVHFAMSVAYSLCLASSISFVYSFTFWGTFKSLLVFVNDEVSGNEIWCTRVCVDIRIHFPGVESLELLGHRVCVHVALTSRQTLFQSGGSVLYHRQW